MAALHAAVKAANLSNIRYIINNGLTKLYIA
jgi:hypothetical protein